MNIQTSTIEQSCLWISDAQLQNCPIKFDNNLNKRLVNFIKICKEDKLTLTVSLNKKSQTLSIHLN